MLNHFSGEHEVKYIIGNCRAHHVLNWLRCNCIPDPDYQAGIVSSIYFDTVDWAFLQEKINSDFLKTKIRVRWYTDIDTKVHYPGSFVEAKFKYGSKRDKVRIPTPYSGAWLAAVRLEDPRLLTLPFLLKPQGVNLAENLFPAYMVTYKRFRFIEPATRLRVCFDSDIFAPKVNAMMLPRQNPFSIQTAVLEIKGNARALPTGLRPLVHMGFKKSSFSKYGACYRKITGSFC